MTFTFGGGDYAMVPAGTPVPFATISCAGTGLSATLTSSNNPEWSIVVGGTTYQFNLLGLTSATMTDTQVSVNGSGVAFISGATQRDPTSATFILQGNGNGFNYTFAVPEPGTGALFGFGAAVALVWRRRLQRGQATLRELPSAA